jgi:hypothetical protein
MTGFYFLRLGEIQGLKCRTGFSKIRPPEAREWTKFGHNGGDFEEIWILALESMRLAMTQQGFDCGQPVEGH